MLAVWPGFTLYVLVMLSGGVPTFSAAPGISVKVTDVAETEMVSELASACAQPEARTSNPQIRSSLSAVFLNFSSRLVASELLY